MIDMKKMEIMSENMNHKISCETYWLACGFCFDLNDFFPGRERKKRLIFSIIFIQEPFYVIRSVSFIGFMDID